MQENKLKSLKVAKFKEERKMKMMKVLMKVGMKMIMKVMMKLGKLSESICKKI